MVGTFRAHSGGLTRIDQVASETWCAKAVHAARPSGVIKDRGQVVGDQLSILNFFIAWGLSRFNMAARGRFIQLGWIHLKGRGSERHGLFFLWPVGFGQERP